MLKSMQSGPGLQALPNGAGHGIKPRADADMYDGKGGARLRRPPLSNVAGEIPVTDWDLLLNAIKARLLSTAGDALADLPEPMRQQSIHQIQAGMVDCVAALDQLHLSLSKELAKRQHLKQEVSLAQAALARKHIELQGTRAQERRSHHLARHDGLTTLPNRNHFCQCLDQAMEQAQQQEQPAPTRPALAVFFLDLDGFKKINDTYGHDQGDEVLKIVAGRIKQAVRTNDMVGRLGGDEFGCFLTGFPGRDQVYQQARKIFEAVADLPVGELALVVRPSIGIAVWPDDGHTGAVLLKQADRAMYQAKRKGSGCAFLEVK